MKKFYVTLCRELVGYCIRAEAPSEIALTHYLNKHYGGAWCRVTEQKPPEEVMGQVLFLNDEDAEGDKMKEPPDERTAPQTNAGALEHHIRREKQIRNVTRETLNRLAAPLK